MNQTNKSDKRTPTGEIVIYQTEDGKTKIEVRFVTETGGLFGVNPAFET